MVADDRSDGPRNSDSNGQVKTEATWLAGNANDDENAVQKKSQMQIMEEQLSKNRSGGWALLTGVLGCLAILDSASTDPSGGTGESQVLGSSSWLHCLLRGAVGGNLGGRVRWVQGWEWSAPENDEDHRALGVRLAGMRQVAAAWSL